ncbi:peptidase family C50-domain-containing protein [Pestalotiopsis sp. NC0098]|nr:peptidase family C50-domain-containing protein [Pestalotiopsis sp. NC0098]
MASLITTQTDALCSAVANVQTCTPAVSIALRGLLQGEEVSEVAPKTTAKSKTTKTTATARGKTATTTTKRAAQTKTPVDQQDGGLSPKEKATLATRVINATLKSLGEAAKNPTTKAAHDKPVKPTARGAPRRSNSMPMTPLQPRSLNRVSTSPSVAKSGQAQTGPTASSECLATVECAHAAFATLRTLSAAGKVPLPELQLESGMSSFINKLMALNLFEHALKELRILKRRLEGIVNGAASKKSKPAAAVTDSASTAKSLTDLFDYSATTASGSVLALVISSQLQALRLLHGMRKSRVLETALPFLSASNPSSPLSLLLSSLKEEKADRLKCARQLDSLAHSLLSLTPSVSSQEDAAAMDPKLSPSAEASFQIQALGLLTRLHSWALSGHKGSVDNDILLPLSRCLSAFSRRSASAPVDKLSTINSIFNELWQKTEFMSLKPSQASKSPLATIYQALGTASREAGKLKEAMSWVKKLKEITTLENDSPARYCAVTAQLIALSLKQSPSTTDHVLLTEVLDGMQGSLSGSSAELDDLLACIYQVRSAAIKLVLGDSKVDLVPATIRDSLESLILQLPRFSSRWLGKPPASTTSAKDLVRFEQRRQLLSKYIPTILDSALMLIKDLLEKKKMPWDLMDSVLQEALAVLDNMGDLAFLQTKGNAAATYHVKISHFYYQQHVLLRQEKDGHALRALRRSIDAVKDRPEAEQSRAQLILKQERLAELCRSSGRKEDATDTLRAIRDSLCQEDATMKVFEALSQKSVLQAWTSNDKASSLSRTVCSLAKLDSTPCDWTWLLPDAHKVSALEHDFHFIYLLDPKRRKQLVPGGSFVESLLQAIDPQAHPIRRLRTLLQLLSVNLDSQDVVQCWVEEARSLSEEIDNSSSHQDSGLSRYIPHLKSLSTCICALMQGELDTGGVEEALQRWKEVVGKSQSASDLNDYIDSPSQLITILQGLADFARMRGMSSLLGSTLSLSTTVSQILCEDNPELFMSHIAASCLQHLTLGHSTKAEELLKTGKDFLSQKTLSSESMANYHLCSAEYEMSVGNFERAEQCLIEAHTFASAQSAEKPTKSSRLASKMSVAYASFLHSLLALERGRSDHALHNAKTAVRVLFHDWQRLESLRTQVLENNDDVSQSQLAEDDASFNNSQCSQLDFARASTGPEFWAIVYPLFRFVMRLSTIYANIGMYQETIYYAEQAMRIALSTESPSHISQARYWLAHVFMKSGNQEKALELATQVKESLPSLEPTCNVVEMTCQLSRIYRHAMEVDTEAHLLTMADSMLDKLGWSEGNKEPLEIESKMEKLSIQDKPAPKASTRQTRTKAATTTTRKTTAKKPAPAKEKKVVEKKAPQLPQDTQLTFLRASVLQHKSSSLLDRKDWAAAVASLETAYELSKLSTDIVQERLLMAMAFIGQSLELMGRDSVFSVIQDSTLSFPAVAAASSPKAKTERSPVRSTSPRRGRPAANALGFLADLQQAYDCLIEAHSIASLNGDAGLVYRIAALMQNVFILLSTTNPSKSSGIGHPAHATCSIELARNLVWRRERKTLRVDQSKSEKAEWPILQQVTDPRRSSLGFSMDMTKFQREFVDIIPKSWNVVSISLSDNKRDLCITKLQAHHSPFAIRLPLERANSRDADSEVFDFQQGRAEMLEIIREANRTCHDARDMNEKGAKSAWWAERQALDERMKELLENVEHTWLGGFRGIFAQHRRTDLLARFQKSFQNILDKHLPSRQQVRGKRTKAAATTGKVSLDPRILDLFIGLGDATAPECDLDDPLNDLLYFVVDILQFHGERNAYDEVDFDAMVIETFDALRSYHAAAKGNGQSDEHVHTILVLDKALHIFPWESMPCTQGISMSRVPSLACLRRSIQEQRASPVQCFESSEEVEAGNTRAEASGHHISFHSGTYILNPGADLKSTQATFGKPLATLPPTWSSIETRVPTETEFEESLTKSDLLLYFGHGSGAQYIRGRTIRKMEKCRAVALLMGCSSASLADVGDFESHGPVWNYMLAGSPAVVGTLWDVTDRDIDRYTGRVFEEWGLMPSGTFAEDGPNAKGKGKTTKGRGKKAAKSVNEADQSKPGTKTSLVEAVTKARDACLFRYLTAAAVVVYGIPVYINK